MDQLTKLQRSLIVGSLLGDGYIAQPSPGKGNPTLCIQHSDSQLDYLLWKAERLREAGFDNIGIYRVRNGRYKAHRIIVPLGDYGKILRHQFYPNGNKTITRHLLNMLTAEGIAIWYMDDGGICIHKKKDGSIKGREVHIATHAFTYEEHVIIKRYLDVVWNVQAKIYRDRNWYRLAFNATEGRKFLDIVRPYIHPSLSYKVDMKYKMAT